jgi:cysteine-rich secretory family protein
MYAGALMGALWILDAALRRSLAAGALAVLALAAPLAVSAADPVDPAQLCVDLINRKRASINAPLLERWREGERLAASQAAEDGRDQTPHGAYRRRIESGAAETSAQNECNDTDTRTESMIGACINGMWAEGPEAPDGREHGHYVNMSSNRYSQVACGFALAPDGRMWSVQNFIAAADAGSGPPQPGPRAGPNRGAAPPPAPVAVDPVAFDRGCVGAMNRLRSDARLVPYRSWPGGAACASGLAAIRARGAQPTAADQVCLGDHGWGSNECRSSVTAAEGVLQGCLKRSWGAGPAAQPSGSQSYLASSVYHEAACGFARAPNGASTIVQIFR